MKALRAVLADRKRAQQGSVLSAVLIIVAFLAIIAGALMTELSTSFLLSRNLMNRVNTEATVNSAMELALNQLQNTQVTGGCPGPVSGTPAPGSTTLNSRTAAVSYLGCFPTVRESPQYASIAPSTPFNVDGTHSIIPGTFQDLYVVADAGGNVYSYPFGQGSAIWSRNMQSAVTGPPMAMQDAACQGGPPCPDIGTTNGVNADISYLVPIAGGGSSGCAAACVVLLGQDVPNAPDVTCYMPTSATVTSRPAGGGASPQLAYLGDGGGTVYAYNATEFCGGNPGTATLVASRTNAANAAIVAGPVVFQNGTRDEIYVVISKGATSQLIWYEYRQGSTSLTQIDVVNLPYLNPIGLAVEKPTAPARLAITFGGGGVAIISVNSGFDPSVAQYAPIGTGFASAPTWCACPGGPQIGVAGLNGALYVVDPNLNPIASSSGGSSIRTSPASDGVGEWFFGADDGYLHELQLTPGQSNLVQVAQYGAMGRVGSSVQVAGCRSGNAICIYLGTTNSAYLVALDARDARITACLSNAPPACSGDNPRLWAQVEVGAINSSQAVHVQGWSYYSP